MMNSRRWICVFALTILAGPAFAQQPAAAGKIKLASGQVFVVRGGNSLPAMVGQDVYESDSLRTGNDGRLGITLKDDTRVSLGPGSEVQLNKFLYRPAESQFAVALKLVRGMAAYVSGRIAKLAPDAVRLETPAAIVGVRGTTLVLRTE